MSVSEVEIPKPELKRRGDVEKCPVCGTRVDPQAYHCPNCRNYFCFHCRARLLASDKQLQCCSQECDYYGKLICGVCDAPVQKTEPPSVYSEPEDGYWPGLLALGLLALVVIWISTSSFLWAAGISSGVCIAAGILLHRAGVNIFGQEIRVEQSRVSTYHSCVSCHQPVKGVRSAGPGDRRSDPA